MSRLERKFPTEDALPADSAEILAALEKQSAEDRGASKRSGMIARYLSAEDGWKEASRTLRGAFAPHGDDQRLMRPKGE